MPFAKALTLFSQLLAFFVSKRSLKSLSLDSAIAMSLTLFICHPV